MKFAVSHLWIHRWQRASQLQGNSEHAGLLELRDVGGNISSACESCYTLPCLRCCNLHGVAGTVLYLWEFRGIGKEEKTINLLWLIQRYQWKYQRGTCHSQWKTTTGIYWQVVHEERVGKWILWLGMCEGWGESILGYQTLSINVSVGRKIRSLWDLHHYSLVILKKWKMMKGNFTKNAKMHCCLRCKRARNFLQTLEI